MDEMNETMDKRTTKRGEDSTGLLTTVVQSRSLVARQLACLWSQGVSLQCWLLGYGNPWQLTSASLRRYFEDVGSLCEYKEMGSLLGGTLAHGKRSITYSGDMRLRSDSGSLSRIWVGGGGVTPPELVKYFNHSVIK